MNNPTATGDDTMASVNAWPELNTREDLLKTPAWIVQYNLTSATLLREEWNSATDEATDDEGFIETPAITRHLDEIRPGDFILFWIAGSGDNAGLYAWGQASGEPTEENYPKDWKNPEGQHVIKTAMEVQINDVLHEPLVTRTTLQRFPEFADFELFTMPNRANAFAVTTEQWSIILDYVTGRRTDS